MAIFSKEQIGLDIQDNAIELVLVEKKFGKIKIKNFLYQPISSGIIEKGRIVNEQKLDLALKSVFENKKVSGTKKDNIVCGIPTRHVYTHVFAIKSEEKQNILQMVLQELKNSIPEEIENILYNYKIIVEKEGKVEILLVAVKKTLLSEWKNFFQKYNYKNVSFDIETFALLRGLFDKKVGGPVCVLDLGETTTDIYIVDKYGLHFGYSANIAGGLITKQIAKSLKMSVPDAEARKKEVGIIGKSGKILKAPEKMISDLLQELVQVLRFYYKKSGEKVESIVLTGGTSLLLGLKEIIEKKIGLPTVKGKPYLLQNVTGDQFIEAFGLSLAGLVEKSFGEDMVFNLMKEAKIQISYKNNREQKKESFEEEPVLQKIENETKKYKAFENKKRMILFLSTLFLSICVFVGILYFGRTKNEKIYSENTVTGLLNQEVLEHVRLKVPLGDSKDNLLVPKILERTVDMPKGLEKEDVIKSTYTQLLSEIDTTWILSETPYFSDENNGKVTFRWFALEPENIKESFVDSLQTQYIDIPFYLKQIDIGKIELSLNELGTLDYYIHGDVTLFLNN